MLSGSYNITWEIVINNPNLPWDYDQLSLNPNITWDIVKNNPDKPWNYDYLSENPNITWDIVINNPDKPWNYYYLSKNTNITWDIVKNNLDKSWNYIKLLKKPSVTLDIIKLNKNLNWDNDYRYMFIENFNDDFIDGYDNTNNYNVQIEPLTYLYDYYAINPNITIEFIDDNINLISFEQLSNNLFSYLKQHNYYN
jgi:hypothetical protein